MNANDRLEIVLSERELKIFRRIWDSVERAMGEEVHHVDRSKAATARRVREQAKRGIVACESCRWFGVERLNASCRVQLARVIRSLEKHRLIERLNLGYGGERMTHVQLTKFGCNRLADFSEREVMRLDKLIADQDAEGREADG